MSHRRWLGLFGALLLIPCACSFSFVPRHHVLPLDPPALRAAPIDINPQDTSLRRLAAVRKFPRLPIWPIWNGLLIMLLDKLGLRALSQTVEDRLGGRVCPQIFLPSGQEGGDSNMLGYSDPFLLLVYHRHSFSLFDPLRFLQRVVFPEGFPAHPHSGFCTLTYVLQGAVRHRDSMGVKQVYGDGCAQFLSAGRGVIHEEMWELGTSVLPQDITLFQLWLNVPATAKSLPPSLSLIGPGQAHPMPEVVVGPPTASTRLRVVMGEARLDGARGFTSPLVPGVCVMHGFMQPRAEFQLPVKPDDNVLIYILRGWVTVGRREGGRVDTHETGFFTRGEEVLQLSAGEGGGGEFLLLIGQPLSEPVVASGPFVCCTEEAVAKAYSAYQAGEYGVPWEPTTSDEEWRALCGTRRDGYVSKDSGD